MDSNDATILALSLGIPSATLLSIAFLLVLRIEYRQLQAQRIRNPTVPTNSPAPSPPSRRPVLWHPARAATALSQRTLTTATDPTRRVQQSHEVGGELSLVDFSHPPCAKASYPSQKAHACHHHLPHHVC